MKQRLLLFITFLPGILLAQQKVIFPDNFNTSLDGKEVKKYISITPYMITQENLDDYEITGWGR